ncbi:MAG: hypothetical protein ACYTDY_09695 [Planctomycetota bacterium]
MSTNRYLATALAGAALLAAASTASAEMSWHSDIRESLEEAEGRGVPLLVYLSRDD